MDSLNIMVVGGGVLGLWQAMVLSARGHRVTLREAAPESLTGAASRMAGAMLAPYCECEAAEPIVQDLGLQSIEIWKRTFPEVASRGTLVVAAHRDQPDLRRFARMTSGHVSIDGAGINQREPALAGRFPNALFYPGEGHIAPRRGLELMVETLRRRGVDVRFSAPVPSPLWMSAPAGDIVIDCRGFSARGELKGLRGVRGEMAVVRANGVNISRPVRLLHPRIPVYVVPWSNETYMIGATVIESDWSGEVTLRSALDLLAAAAAIHPGLMDGHILEFSSGIRPAFSDNIPKIGWQGRCLTVNGAYRHGFLTSPALAEIVADHLEGRGDIPTELRMPD